MAGSGEAAHVGADLRDDDLRGQITDAGDGPQLVDRLTERVEITVHLRVDLGNGGVERINITQMQAERCRSVMRPCKAARSRAGCALTPRCTRVSSLSGSSSPSISAWRMSGPTHP